MSLNFVPTRETLDDLLTLGTLNDDQVTELTSAFSLTDQHIETPDGLLAVAASVISDFSVAQALVRQLLSISHLSRRTGKSFDEIVGIIENEFAQVPELLEDAEDDQRIKQCIQAIGKMAGVVAFKRTSKAIELTYDCDNLLQRTRVMTDVRPLFSADAQDIDGAVVSHTLRIRYDSAGNDREMSLALDDADLMKLIDDCKRALLKGRTARSKMCNPGNIPTMPSKDENNDK